MRIKVVRWLPIKHTAITLPPFGVFFKESWWKYATPAEREPLIRHEKTHWFQYEERGLFRFYLGYFFLWLRYGYKNHPWELEAKASE